MADIEEISSIKGKLIVSCQALPDEPLHSSFIMGKMAKAAKQGGAKGIRANTSEDIKEIKNEVDLPVIGIVKKDYENSKVYITPTMKEVDDLISSKAEIIAMDATKDLRPGGIGIDEFFKEVKKKYPNQLFMADCSTVDEAINADKLVFDFIGKTLVGYSDQSKNDKIEENDFKILRDILKNVNNKVIAEGNINTPEKAKRVLELGAYSVVVGSIITRPQVITKNFAEKINELEAGFSTLLTKEFSAMGAVFSGGESQKLALSRLFVNDRPIMILDEPSSALDPISENKIINRIFERYSKNTIFFISHRLNTAALADKIIVMEKGRIVELGTHESLMGKRGVYYNLYKATTDNYKIK